MDGGGQPPSSSGHRRNAIGTSSLLSKIQAPFMRSSPPDQTSASSQNQNQHQHQHQDYDNSRQIDRQGEYDASGSTPSRPQSSIGAALLQQKTRRRKGSLRKVALLGRGAQRERREARNLSHETQQGPGPSLQTSPSGFDGGGQQPQTAVVESPAIITPAIPTAMERLDYSEFHRDLGTAGGLGISDITPRPSMDGYAKRPPELRNSGQNSKNNNNNTPAVSSLSVRPIDISPPSNMPETTDRLMTSPAMTSYSTTTTDDEDGIHIARRPSPPPGMLLHPNRLSSGSGSESYFTGVGGPGPGGIPTPSSSFSSARVPLQRRRSVQRAKSPLALTSLGGVASSSLPGVGGGHQQEPPEWDYAETEWWGWVVLLATWLVFVTGMGSCLGVWSWAWDVGTTPYAPPELEDDPTLPIVGYYPALIILTCVMAWVWVLTAWVGMKYFRHAKISGD